MQQSNYERGRKTSGERGEMTTIKHFTGGIALVILVAAGSALVCRSQNAADENKVVIQSWQKGARTVSEGTFNLDLIADEYHLDIGNANGSLKMILQMEKVFIPTIKKPNLQCVSFSLNELFAHSDKAVRVLGANVLLEGNLLEKPANIVCPIDKPSAALYGGHYSINATRIFHVEAFTLRIRASKADYDSGTNRLTNIRIELRLEDDRTPK